MADKADAGGGKKDTTAYSPSKAPETQSEAEEKESTVDPRAIPGGAHGAAADVGMNALDQEAVPAGHGRTTPEHPERIR